MTPKWMTNFSLLPPWPSVEVFVSLPRPIEIHSHSMIAEYCPQLQLERKEALPVRPLQAQPLKMMLHNGDSWKQSEQICPEKAEWRPKWPKVNIVERMLQCLGRNFSQSSTR